MAGQGIRDFQTNTFIAGISGVTIAGGVPVVIDANGQLGSTTSSERFKDEIKPMDKASEAILASNRSPSTTRKGLTRMASRNLASWLRKWKK